MAKMKAKRAMHRNFLFDIGRGQLERKRGRELFLQGIQTDGQLYVKDACEIDDGSTRDQTEPLKTNDASKILSQK